MTVSGGRRSAAAGEAAQVGEHDRARRCAARPGAARRRPRRCTSSTTGAGTKRANSVRRRARSRSSDPVVHGQRGQTGEGSREHRGGDVEDPAAGEGDLGEQQEQADQRRRGASTPTERDRRRPAAVASAGEPEQDQRVEPARGVAQRHAAHQRRDGVGVDLRAATSAPAERRRVDVAAAASRWCRRPPSCPRTRSGSNRSSTTRENGSTVVGSGPASWRGAGVVDQRAVGAEADAGDAAPVARSATTTANVAQPVEVVREPAEVRCPWKSTLPTRTPAAARSSSV